MSRAPAGLTVFFTADTHFGHGGALGLYRRPFASVSAMDDALIAAWRERVTAQDEVWHLGDFALGPKPERLAALFAALPGRKHLITGNNDKPPTLALAWASVQPYSELTADIGGAPRLVVLCHYAFRSWRDMHRGAVNLHGHSHGRLTPLPRQFDVGVDARDFRPVRLEDILPPGRRREQ